MHKPIYIPAVCALLILTASALAEEPQDAASPKPDSLIHEEFETGSVGTSLGAARGAFLEVDARKAGEQIRSAAKQLRDAATTVADDSRASLHEAAHELDKLAKRVEEESVESVHELDKSFARAFHSLAQHHIQIGNRSWKDREHRLAGRRLRAAADNLDTAFKSSGQRINSATQETIRESRMLSAKLVEGSGYAVDDVGRVFESLGEQVEGFGARMEPPAKRYPDRLIVPK